MTIQELEIHLNNLAAKAYATATRQGFHDQEQSAAHYMCLVITELAEAVNAERSSRWARVPREKIGTILDPRTFHAKGENYTAIFEDKIKDTVEDELADAVIRLLDFAAAKDMKVVLDDWLDDWHTTDTPKWEAMSFTEAIAYIIGVPYTGKWGLTSNLQKPPLFEYRVNRMIGNIFSLAHLWSIDLLWHIEQKMEYNTTRRHMHGKKY